MIRAAMRRGRLSTPTGPVDAAAGALLDLARAGVLRVDAEGLLHERNEERQPRQDEDPDRPEASAGAARRPDDGRDDRGAHARRRAPADAVALRAAQLRRRR